MDTEIMGLNEEIQDLIENEEYGGQTPTATNDNLTSVNMLEISEYLEPELLIEHETQNQEELPIEVETQNQETGKIMTVGVEVFSDPSINNQMSNVDWGILSPGAEKNVECYIHNIGETASILTLETANWNSPQAESYITLTWDYDGQQLAINQSIKVTLTLTISENIQGVKSFFFDIIIIGSSV